MANTTADKLAKLETTKAELKSAINENGGSVGDVFSDYPTAVRAMANSIIPVSRGGTGSTSLNAGYALIGNGTDAVGTRAITNLTSTASALTANTNLITANTLRYIVNRTGSVAAANTSYTTLMARGSSLHSAETTPSVNGAIAWQYE